MLQIRAVHIYNDNAMMHLRIILQQRQKQLALDKVFVQEKKASAEKEDSSEIKRQRREKMPDGQLPSHLTEGTSITAIPPSLLRHPSTHKKVYQQIHN